MVILALNHLLFTFILGEPTKRKKKKLNPTVITSDNAA